MVSEKTALGKVKLTFYSIVFIFGLYCMINKGQKLTNCTKE